MNRCCVHRAMGAALVLGGVCAISAHAETVTLDPLKDTTLYSDADGFLADGFLADGFLADGAGEFNFIGRTGSRGGGSPRRSLMEFDLSNIPAGAAITGATLTMHVLAQRYNQTGQPHTTPEHAHRGATL